MIVVVTGGRDYEDRVHVWARLDRVHESSPITLLMHGACYSGGADLLGEGWARSREVEYYGMPARFRTGQGAPEGPARNDRMLRRALQFAQIDVRPVAVFAWPGGRGTANCVNRARKLGLTVEPCCEHHPLAEVS